MRADIYAPARARRPSGSAPHAPPAAPLPGLRGGPTTPGRAVAGAGPPRGPAAAPAVPGAPLQTRGRARQSTSAVLVCL